MLTNEKPKETKLNKDEIPLAEGEEKIELEIDRLANILIDAFLDSKNMSGGYPIGDDEFSSILFPQIKYKNNNVHRRIPKANE